MLQTKFEKFLQSLKFKRKLYCLISFDALCAAALLSPTGFKFKKFKALRYFSAGVFLTPHPGLFNAEDYISV